MSKMASAIDKIINEDNGYSTTYHRKPDDAVEKAHEALERMTEDQLDVVERQIKMIRERLDHKRKVEQREMNHGF